MGWSPDGRKIFYAWGKPTQWSSIDAVTRQRVDVIHSEKYNLHMLRQSADGNWLAFHMPTFTERRLFTDFHRADTKRRGRGRKRMDPSHRWNGIGLDALVVTGRSYRLLPVEAGRVCVHLGATSEW